MSAWVVLVAAFIAFVAWHGVVLWRDLRTCRCVGYTIRTDYGTGIEHDVDRSSCRIHRATEETP